MKKLLGLFSAISLFATTGINVIACEENGDIKNDDPKEVDTRIDLNEIQKELGSFFTSAYAENLLPKDEKLRERINEKNNLNLDYNDIIIENKTETTAVIKAKYQSKKIKGEGKVSFNTKIDLSKISSDIFKEFHLATRTPESNDVLEKINEEFSKYPLNINLQLDKDVSIQIEKSETKGQGKAIVSTINTDKYVNKAELKYGVKLDLDKINADLGEITGELELVQKKYILEKVFDQNPKFELDDFDQFKRDVHIVKSSMQNWEAIIRVSLQPFYFKSGSEKKLNFTYKQIK